uniref:Uncharacterized protein n=1 Tax=Micrurus spixii TaxID=129469 RepID=A0A2D4MZF1_9SAUR
MKITGLDSAQPFRCHKWVNLPVFFFFLKKQLLEYIYFCIRDPGRSQLRNHLTASWKTQADPGNRVFKRLLEKEDMWFCKRRIQNVSGSKFCYLKTKTKNKVIDGSRQNNGDQSFAELLRSPLFIFEKGTFRGVLFPSFCE